HKALLHFGISDGCVDRSIELFDDFSWRVLRRTDGQPAASVVAWHEFVQGGDSRERLQTLRIRDGKSPQLTVTDIIDALGYGHETDVSLATQQIGHVAVTIWHVNQVRAGHHFEQ